MFFLKIYVIQVNCWWKLLHGNSTQKAVFPISSTAFWRSKFVSPEFQDISTIICSLMGDFVNAALWHVLFDDMLFLSNVIKSKLIDNDNHRNHIVK